ncbi:histidine kinase [Kibdelosporangium philippinense]|uniref:Histidine kinase n=1 Tax=Kibdelosporangium philippinense TaxID=211113 RepID=A0ABS8ZF53_9PSEU|nr:histidine kinase [Kibdelosporangium philippinense]MCE7005713.1 histidine kinase [Kibdelosporangium philippinense]
MAETVLEPLRRMTRRMLLFTELVVLLPLFFVLRLAPNPYMIAVIGIGTAVMLTVRIRNTLRLMRGPWEPFSNLHLYGLSALALMLSTAACAVDVLAGSFSTVFVGMAASEYFVGRTMGYAWRRIGILVAVQVALLVVVLFLTGQQAALGVLLFTSTFMTVALAFSVGMTYRQWEGALKLEQARRDAADLAATRERLRLAEDLHDILGHALEVVSLKSELAVRLTDAEKSKAEMIEVQQLARNALRDVRALVQGNRPTDFATELTGARKLLESAGISCDFAADPADLTTGERDLFGRVLREAMTNALRHSDPRSCSVSLAAKPDSVVLRVVNDGVAPLQSAEDGSGLVSLTRRVTAAGGSFTAGNVEPASFEVIASLPR